METADASERIGQRKYPGLVERCLGTTRARHPYLALQSDLQLSLEPRHLIGDLTAGRDLTGRRPLHRLRLAHRRARTAKADRELRTDRQVVVEELLHPGDLRAALNLLPLDLLVCPVSEQGSGQLALDFRSGLVLAVELRGDLELNLVSRLVRRRLTVLEPRVIGERNELVLKGKRGVGRVLGARYPGYGVHQHFGDGLANAILGEQVGGL